MTDDKGSGENEDRSPIDEKEWQSWQLEGEGEENLDEQTQIEGEGHQGQEPFRVQENIASRVPVWYGVRSCSDQNRAKQEMAPHFNRWVDATIAAHPNNVAAFKGYSGAIWWENRTSSTGKKRCKGGFLTLNVYVDFV